MLLALDCASTEYFKDGSYALEGEGKTLTPEAMVDYLADLAANYPIASIEDGMAEDDMAGWKLLTERLGSRVQLVGDDLFVTNEKRLAQGIKDGIANSILVKVNQIGTLSETVAAVRLAQSSGYTAVMSHRRARPRIRPSPTSRSLCRAARSRPAASPGPTERRSITSCSGSRRSSAKPRAMRDCRL